MPIEIACGCGKRFRVGDAHAGKSGTCPGCGAGFTVPVPKGWKGAWKQGERGAHREDERDGLYALAERETASQGSEDGGGLRSLDAADVEVRRAKGSSGGRAKGRTCSGCGGPIAERAIICTACGRSTLTGKTIKPEIGDDAGPKRTFFLFRPLVEFGSLRVSPALLIVLALLVAAPIHWWMSGPGRRMVVYDAGRVWVIPAMKTGATRDGFSLLTGQGDMSLGVEGGIGGVAGGQADDGDALHYSIGGSDELFVLRDGDDAGQGEGQGILLEVGLQQTVIRAAGSTSGYDAVVRAGDFELVPLEGQHGGEALPAKLLSATFFQSEAVLDIGGAKTTSVHKALPAAEPTRFNEQKERGGVSAIAVYDGETVGTRGTVRLSASRSVDGYPAADGVTAMGELTTTHPAEPGFVVEHRYGGGDVTIDWDDGDQGRWATDSIRKHADMSPYHRYKFGLLFLPEYSAGPVGGKYAVRYAGRELATVEIGSGVGLVAEATRPQGNAGSGAGGGSLAARGKASSGGPVSPIKTQQGVPSNRTINPNNPLSYFDILLETRDRARGIVSASNLRQIGLSLLTYLQDRGQWPETFEELELHVPGVRALLHNPRTGENPGFIYEKPAAGADPSTTPVVWETYGGAKDPNGAVLYADGSIR